MLPPSLPILGLEYKQMDYDPENSTHSTQESPVSNTGSLWRFLDWVEEIIWRMIVGVIRFIFRELPKWVIDILKEWFPTFTKLIKVILLIVTFLIISFGPGVYVYLSTHNLYFYSYQYPKIIVFEPWVNWIMYGWTTVAILGALWGLIRLRIRRKGRGFIKNAIKTLFGKRNEDYDSN